jgi:glutamine amidotransferase
MIAVIDYGAGNLRSIQRALEAAGADVVVTSDPAVVRAADAAVLPGVGHAGHSVDRLISLGLDGAIRDSVESGKPFLGICVGMQVLFEDQEEGGGSGLGLLPGKVRSIPESVKTPHMGWNRSRIVKSGPLGAVDDEAFYYFVHSFVAEPTDPNDVVAVVEYGETYPSVVVRDNVWGMQFHPEKSGADGLALIKKFVDVVAIAALRELVTDARR